MCSHVGVDLVPRLLVLPQDPFRRALDPFRLQAGLREQLRRLRVRVLLAVPGLLLGLRQSRPASASRSSARPDSSSWRASSSAARASSRARPPPVPPSARPPAPPELRRAPLDLVEGLPGRRPQLLRLAARLRRQLLGPPRAVSRSRGPSPPPPRGRPPRTPAPTPPPPGPPRRSPRRGLRVGLGGAHQRLVLRLGELQDLPRPLAQRLVPLRRRQPRTSSRSPASSVSRSATRAVSSTARSRAPSRSAESAARKQSTCSGR